LLPKTEIILCLSSQSKTSSSLTGSDSAGITTEDTTMKTFNQMMLLKFLPALSPNSQSSRMRVKETQLRTSLTPTQLMEACQRTKAIFSNTLTDQDSSSGNLAPVHRAPPSGYISKNTIEITGSKTFPKLYKKSLAEPWTFVKSSRLPAENHERRRAPRQPRVHPLLRSLLRGQR